MTSFKKFTLAAYVLAGMTMGFASAEARRPGDSVTSGTTRGNWSAPIAAGGIPQHWALPATPMVASGIAPTNDTSFGPYKNLSSAVAEITIFTLQKEGSVHIKAVVDGVPVAAGVASVTFRVFPQSSYHFQVRGYAGIRAMSSKAGQSPQDLGLPAAAAYQAPVGDFVKCVVFSGTTLRLDFYRPGSMSDGSQIDLGYTDLTLGATTAGATCEEGTYGYGV